MPFSRLKSIMKMKPSVKVIQSKFFALSGGLAQEQGLAGCIGCSKLSDYWLKSGEKG